MVILPFIGSACFFFFFDINVVFKIFMFLCFFYCFNILISKINFFIIKKHYLNIFLNVNNLKTNYYLNTKHILT